MIKMEKEKVWIKPTITKKGRNIKGHYRAIQEATFNKGYQKAKEFYKEEIEELKKQIEIQKWAGKNIQHKLQEIKFNLIKINNVRRIKK
ncbi:hypothetical protein LCGC14_0737890 [marine sediment metagenome]|uniref:Uncharacterized protein n=1 Tax=marine sediment metagenome TaxID=412755 RepID=A0A0F9TEV9_9ZZZZ